MTKFRNNFWDGFFIGLPILVIPKILTELTIKYLPHMNYWATFWVLWATMLGTTYYFVRKNEFIKGMIACPIATFLLYMLLMIITCGGSGPVIQ